MKTNSEIKLKEFEDLMKEIDKDKFHITRQIELKDDKVMVTKWEIFNKTFNDINPTVLASYKNNTLQDIVNFIEYNKNLENEKIEVKIFNKLINLGLPVNGLTIRYWDYLLLELYNREEKRYKTTQLYNQIANEFNSTVYAVERVLRYGTEKMKNNIITQYNLPKDIRLTTTTIINLFLERIFYNEI